MSLTRVPPEGPPESRSLSDTLGGGNWSKWTNWVEVGGVTCEPCGNGEPSTTRGSQHLGCPSPSPGAVGQAAWLLRRVSGRPGPPRVWRSGQRGPEGSTCHQEREALLEPEAPRDTPTGGSPWQKASPWGLGGRRATRHVLSPGALLRLGGRPRGTAGGDGTH